MVLTGRIVRGEGKAAFFTQLDWVQNQCQEKFGFKPYPGTLNVEISQRHRSSLLKISMEHFQDLVPPDPQYCTGQTLPVKIGEIHGALIVPAKDVAIHGRQVMEIMAPCRIKDALKVGDGDSITLTLILQKTNPSLLDG